MNQDTIRRRLHLERKKGQANVEEIPTKGKVLSCDITFDALVQMLNYPTCSKSLGVIRALFGKCLIYQKARNLVMGVWENQRT